MAESQNPFDMAGAAAPEADSLAAPAATEPEAAAAPALDAAVFAAPAVPEGDVPTGAGPAGPTIPTPEGDDARVAWRVSNAKAMEDKEDVEKKENEEVKLKAQEWLKRFNEERTTRIEAAKKSNAEQEQSATKGPQGNTPWEKVNSMIDFTFKPPQETEGERERFKKLLFSAKDKNVPCPV